ncbi:MAG: phage major capsid protein [Oscillospiraceae bacterium]|jgi:hypothetical protein|nr:phage major capsid protein [Oscillospiraceae bacterium]
MATFETLRLEKGMYSGNFTNTLEKLDPSENYRDTPLAGMDAFQRQLKRFGIHVSGSGSDRVEKFFQSSDSAVLFPEYIARAIKQGMSESDSLSHIVATTTVVDAPDYRPLTLTIGNGTIEPFPVVNEGAALPEYLLKNSSSLVTLQKRGRMFSTSYEALRFHRLDLFTVFLKKMGALIAQEQFADAVSVLLSGANALPAEGAEAFSYADLITLWNALAPHKLSAIVATPAVLTALLGLEQLQDAAAGLNFHGSGKLITPLGATLIGSYAASDDTIIGVDGSGALEMVTAGEVLLDTGKLIDRQLSQASVSCLAGFSKIYDDSVRVLTLQG